MDAFEFFRDIDIRQDHAGASAVVDIGDGVAVAFFCHQSFYARNGEENEHRMILGLRPTRVTVDGTEAWSYKASGYKEKGVTCERFITEDGRLLIVVRGTRLCSIIDPMSFVDKGLSAEEMIDLKRVIMSDERFTGRKMKYTAEELAYFNAERGAQKARLAKVQKDAEAEHAKKAASRDKKARTKAAILQRPKMQIVTDRGTFWHTPVKQNELPLLTNGWYALMDASGRATHAIQVQISKGGGRTIAKKMEVVSSQERVAKRPTRMTQGEARVQLHGDTCVTAPIVAQSDVNALREDPRWIGRQIAVPVAGREGYYDIRLIQEGGVQSVGQGCRDVSSAA